AVAGNAAKALSEIVSLGDAPTCQFCGSLMLRNGSCYRHGMRHHEWMLLKGPQLRSEIPKKIPGARICGTLCHSGRATEGDNDTLLLTPSLRACHVPALFIATQWEALSMVGAVGLKTLKYYNER